MVDHETLERLLSMWLSFSDMTCSELLEYKTAENFFVEHETEAMYLMCIHDGQLKQIGCGLHRESDRNTEFLFAYVGALLDCENEFKTCFSNEIIKTLKKRGE